MPPRHEHGVETRYLRYFVAVADAGSITAASRRLRIAQPALSRQLRALEHEIGSPLLDRGSRGVVLTAAGRAFAADARQILVAIESAVSAARARARGTKGELHVGYAPSPTAELLPPALAALEQAAPEVKVVLHDLGGDELLDGLQSGRLDCTVMVDPGPLLPANIVFHPLRRYAQRAACAPRHAFARLTRVPLARLADEPLVVYDRSGYAEYHETIRALLRPVTASPKIAAECDGLTSLVAAVLARRGVAIVPEIFGQLAGGRLRLRPITPEPPPLVVGYGHRADVSVSATARRLIQALRQQSRRLESLP